jgi:hypothetical protein
LSPRNRTTENSVSTIPSHQPHVQLAEDGHTWLDLADPDGGVDELSEQDTVERVEGMFGRAVDTTLDQRCRRRVTHLLSMVLYQRWIRG